MHYVTVKSILSPRNGMNLYRGCEHGCVYCDSRSHVYGMEHAFEDVAVKENALRLLEGALKSKRRKCMIGTGAMSDPYTPAEREARMTRRALELIERYGFGVALQTKSDGVLEDLELLKRIHGQAKAVVQMTLTTADDRLCALVEPNAPVTSRRLLALKALGEAGIPTVVWLCPILPWINDTQENIAALVTMCAEAGVKGIIQFGMGLTLREGNREYYYAFLDEWFPGLKQRYIRTFGNAYELPSPREGALLERFHGLCEEYGIWHDNGRIFDYLNRLEEREEQISLF